MHGVLPTIESGKPVKQQVEGLLAFASALHRNQRDTAKGRAKSYQRRLAARGTEETVNRPALSVAHSPQPLVQQEDPRSSPIAGGTSGEDEERRERIDSGDGSSDEEVLRKKGTAKILPKISLSARAHKLLLAERKEPKGDEDLSISDAQVLVEKYRKRNRAAEAAVQASVERFHRGRKLQEPLLEDLKNLKKIIADKNRHMHLLELHLGIRHNFAKHHKAAHWEEGGNNHSLTRGSSRSSMIQTPESRPPISKKSGDEGGLSFTRPKDVDVWSGTQDAIS
eukprot:symbB.v1.2.019396.t1/scaffold1549.1/size162750/6